MKKTSAICAVFYFFLTFLLFAQNKNVFHYPFIKLSTWPFYPLNLENSWRYQISFNGGILGYNHETIIDSVEIQEEWFWKKRINEYTGGESSTFLRQEDSTYIKEKLGLGQYASSKCVYKIDAVVDETWLVEISPDDSLNKVWGRLDSTYQIEIFGEIRQSKLYRFRREINGELQAEWFTLLTEGLGLTKFRGGNGGVDFQDMDLVGAIIDAKEYGDPVSVSEAVKNASEPEVFLINYANPFTATTTIEVDLRGFSYNQFMQISVYNLTGQRIRTIYEGIAPPDQRFRTEWDGRDDFKQHVPSGIYFLEIRAGKLLRTKQIVVIK